MNMPIQKRAIATREKLTSAAISLIEKDGYEALRVEAVVKLAGVAKGTFFSHFKDKDALMEQIIGAKLAKMTEDMATAPAPKDIDSMLTLMAPVFQFAASERYVFEIILRHSGAVGATEFGPIVEVFGAQTMIFGDWAKKGGFRPDLDPLLTGEGIGAFLIQALAMNFCALHSGTAIPVRMRSYLEAWLEPRT